MNHNKTLLFEYAISKFIEWYREAMSGDREQQFQSHFTRLTALKLLFFVSAIKNREGEDILDIFDNYCAMQYGPVEVEVYTDIVYKKTYCYNFGNRGLEITGSNKHFDTLSPLEKARIDDAICNLREKNPQLVTYSASHLVDITHKWDSWISAISIAEMSNKGSEPMLIEAIRTNVQFYEKTRCVSFYK